jgi:uncharacterized membrane protein
VFGGRIRQLVTAAAQEEEVEQPGAVRAAAQEEQVEKPVAVSSTSRDPTQHPENPNSNSTSPGLYRDGKLGPETVLWVRCLILGNLYDSPGF